MQFLRNVDSDTLTPYIAVTCILLVMSSFLVPFPVVMFVQDLLFFSYDHTAFIRPSEAYSSFSFGMIWIAIVLFSFFLTKRIYEKKDLKYNLTIVHAVLLIMSIVPFTLSIYHYHYVDDVGIHSNKFETISEVSIAWEDIEEVTRSVDNETYRVYTYTISDGRETIAIPYDPQDHETLAAQDAIKQQSEKYDWEIKDHFR
ncbi:hypothetical protein ACTWQB_13300 [Piscibacillus sp. B03]|uniref:hypothetical protein n=1 Tax=Piscibacillus sp. B03 TaxID=3457430 RepID=UPI003FCC3487